MGLCPEGAGEPLEDSEQGRGRGRCRETPKAWGVQTGGNRLGAQEIGARVQVGEDEA